MRLAPALSRGWPLLILLMGTACERDQPAAKPALALTGRVVDAAGLLSDAEERILTAKLAALEAHDGAQFVVVTTPSLRGEDINSYSINLARTWGLGSKDRNDGLMLLVAPNERRLRIEVGRGLEKTLPDELCGQIIRDVITPRFRQGDMARGIDAGVDALIAATRAKSNIVRAKAA